MATQSTNDTVLFLANGQAKNSILSEDHRDWCSFCEAVQTLAKELARQIILDGEGATKSVEVHVRGARTDKEADTAARSIANSLLVKTAWAGSQPNEGRLMATLGSSSARVEPTKVDILVGDVPVIRQGTVSSLLP